MFLCSLRLLAGWLVVLCASAAVAAGPERAEMDKRAAVLEPIR